MRFIIQDDVFEHLPPDWDEVVAKAETYVAAKIAKAKEIADGQGKDPEEVKAICSRIRHKAINAKAAVWRAAEFALRKASHDKCWYCESKEDRSDKPVDHFRPKNSVIEDPGHPGYYWLAFNWRNYRYSCTYCNSKRRDLEGGTSGGKHDHFPIIPPPNHSRCEADPADHPELLDPVDDEDTKLLTFLPNGFPHPADEQEETKRRVERSVTLYHLHQSALVRKRKMIAAALDEHVSKAEEAVAATDEDNYRYHKKEIIKTVRARAQFSAAARVYLQAHRSKPWVEEILQRDL